MRSSRRCGPHCQVPEHHVAARSAARRKFDSNFQTADTRPHSRGGRRPRFAFRVPQTGGSRKCRMRAAPAVSRAKQAKKTHTSIQVQRRHSGIPCAMALRLTSRSPRRIGLCCLRRLRIAGSSAPGRADLPSADLTPTTEASGPHDFTVRFSIVRPARRCPLTETALRTNFTPDTAASTASHPNVW
jgi:hypothetical protein